MLTVSEIKRFIDDDISSEKKRLAAVGQRYYEAEHDILKCRLFYINDDGKPVEEVISLLKGIKCRANTSCGDQLATALTEYLQKKNG